MEVGGLVWGMGGWGGGRKSEGPARLEWSRRVTLATLKDGASWAHPKKWCKHTVIAIHWVTFSSPGVVQPGSALLRVFISYLGKQEQTQLWFLSLASWQLSLRTQNYCRGTWHAVHTLSPCRKRKQLGAFTAPSIILLFFCCFIATNKDQRNSSILTRSEYMPFHEPLCIAPRLQTNMHVALCIRWHERITKRRQVRPNELNFQGCRSTKSILWIFNNCAEIYSLFIKTILSQTICIMQNLMGLMRRRRENFHISLSC